MPRFPVIRNLVSEDGGTLTGSVSESDHAHITRVLRLGPGDPITVFDEKSFEYEGRIKNISTRNIEVEVLDSRRAGAEPELELNLFQAILKGNKMDRVVRETTQLGVSAIFPVVSQRTLVRSTAKVARWNRIALESTKQCGRTAPPRVAEPADFASSLSLDAASGSEIKIILHENLADSLGDYMASRDRRAGSINIFVGPEGGFSEEEVSLARENGYEPLGLGKRILRAETASVVGVALLQSGFGDM